MTESLQAVIQRMEAILSDFSTHKSGQTRTFSVIDLMKGAESILEEERVLLLLPESDWDSLNQTPMEKGKRLKEMIEFRTKRPWGTKEVLGLRDLADAIYGIYDRKPYTLADKVRLLSLEYRCMWGPEDEPYGYCNVKENLQVDHKRPVSRGGGGGLNLRWLCKRHNLKKSDRPPRWA